MGKISLGAATFLYPMPTVIVGADVQGKPNYVTVAYCGIVHDPPPMISIALAKKHYTNIGIRETHSFSVNIPPAGLVRETDYCGLVSGRDADKGRLFTTFYGKVGAPMIEECPLNLECKVVKVIELSDVKELFIAEIIEVFTEEEYLTDGLVDIKKIDPFVFSIHDRGYWQVGNYLGKAFSIGKELKDEE